MTRLDNDMRGTPILYKAVNVANGRFYIGMTIVGLSDRRSKHFYYAERGGRGKFSAAIRKYGRDNFDFSIISRHETIDECREAERKAIAEQSPYYNLTAGGEGVWGLRHSAESRARMSAAHKGRKGAPCPQWLKEKNSRLMKERLKNGERLGWKPRKIYCLNDGRLFDDIKEAMIFYSLGKHSILRSAHLKRPTACGYHFRNVGART